MSLSCHCQGSMKQLLLLLLLVSVSCAVKPKQQRRASDRSEAKTVNARGCANLTVVLDNWKFAIMTQIKNLLLHDARTVLPDYGRIRLLSDALDDLYKEFNALKVRLRQLTSRFERVESFMDDVNKRRNKFLAKPSMWATKPEAEKDAAPLPVKRRSRVLIQNGKRLTETQTDGVQ